MTDRPTPPVSLRLDDVIEAIRHVHADPLEQLSDAVLGLLHEPESLAASVIRSRKVDFDALRDAAAGVLPPGVDAVPALIPFDADAKKVLELTFREALRLGHNYIGTEHILLALLEVEDGEGVLCGLGLDKASTQAEVVALLNSL